jgi:hypothetical protein
MINEYPIKVVYIAGVGRSGTTLLSLLLNEIQSYHSVGELRYLFNKLFRDDQFCGCGKPLNECKFWRSIIFEDPSITDRVESSQLNEHINELRRLRYSVDKARNLPTWFLMNKINFLKMPPSFMLYAKHLEDLYKSIMLESKCNVIVDSSKKANFAFILSSCANIQLYVIHLVRDARAVTYSYQRKKIRKELPNSSEYMSIHNPYKVFSMWTFRNLLIEQVKRINPNYIRVTYENLVNNPINTLATIDSFVNDTPTQISRQSISTLFQGSNIILRENHTLNGNPMRFDNNKITIKSDDEWKDKLTNKDKNLITNLNFFLLSRYGYI